MTKSIGMIITLAVMLVFIWGCQPQDEPGIALEQEGKLQILHPEPQLQEAEPQELESEQVDVQEAEPQEVEAQVAEAQEAEPQEVEAQVVEAQEEEPEAAESEQIEAEQAREQEPQTSEDQVEEEAQEEGQGEAEITSGRPGFYDACEHIFTTYVDEQGLVDYKTLRRKRADLITAVREFDKVHPAQKISWTRNEKVAFWINAHNIFTLKLIVDNYPIQPRWYLINYPDNSIMHIPSGRDRRYFKVMGLEYTLREIEREILMARFRDPKIFFALSYASMGGAFLRNEPYYPDKLDQQLDEQVRKFLSSDRGLRIDQTKKAIFLSDIFNWYKPVFIEKYGSVKRFRGREPAVQAYLNFIINYVSPDNASYFESNNYGVGFQLYNWHLNEQP
jgi:hypothetical protein